MQVVNMARCPGTEILCSVSADLWRCPCQGSVEKVEVFLGHWAATVGSTCLGR